MIRFYMTKSGEWRDVDDYCLDVREEIFNNFRERGKHYAYIVQKEIKIIMSVLFVPYCNSRNDNWRIERTNMCKVKIEPDKLKENLEHAFRWAIEGIKVYLEAEKIKNCSLSEEDERHIQAIFSQIYELYLTTGNETFYMVDYFYNLPIPVNENGQYVDPYGNTFDSIKDFQTYYDLRKVVHKGIYERNADYRRKEDANVLHTLFYGKPIWCSNEILKPIRTLKEIIEGTYEIRVEWQWYRRILAPNGKTYKSHQQIIRDYRADSKLYHKYQKEGMPLEVCLQTVPYYSKSTTNTAVDEHLIIVKKEYVADDIYYACLLDQEPIVMGRKEIYKYLGVKYDN